MFLMALHVVHPHFQIFYSINRTCLDEIGKKALFYIIFSNLLEKGLASPLHPYSHRRFLLPFPIQKLKRISDLP